MNKDSVADSMRSLATMHGESEAVLTLNAFDLYRHKLPTWGPTYIEDMRSENPDTFLNRYSERQTCIFVAGN